MVGGAVQQRPHRATWVALLTVESTSGSLESSQSIAPYLNLPVHRASDTRM